MFLTAVHDSLNDGRRTEHYKVLGNYSYSPRGNRAKAFGKVIGAITGSFHLCTDFGRHFLADFVFLTV